MDYWNAYKECKDMAENNVLVARSQVPALVVIHKSGKAGKAVISAGMPKSSDHGWQTA